MSDPNGYEPTRYERVTLDDGKRVVLRDPRVKRLEKLGCDCLVGVQVDRHGDEGLVERLHMIQVERIRRRTPLRLSLTYATLEAVT